MATAAVDVKMEECPICTEEYRDARVLECGHHFCRVCLEEIATGHPDGHVTCPTCRHVNQTHGADGVSNLRRYRIVNDFIGSLKAAVDGKNQGSKVSRSCESCKKASVAEKVCLKCNLLLCTECDKKKHACLSGFAGHTTLPLSKYMFCSCHDRDFNMLVCKTCKESCCPRSAMEEHGSHDLSPVETEAENIREQLQETITKIEKSTEEKKVAASVQDLLEKSKSKGTRDDFKASICMIRAGIKELEEKVNQVDEEVNIKLDAEIKHLEMMSYDFKDYLKSLESYKEHLEYLTTIASDHELAESYQDVPQYDPEFYRKLVAKPTIEIPNIGSLLTDLSAKLDALSTELDVTYSKHDLLQPPAITSLTLSGDIRAGNGIYGIVADSKRQNLIVRRCDESCPISVYDYHGNRLQVVGKGIADITSYYEQSISIDTKRDLLLVPVAMKVLQMDMKGTVVLKSGNIPGRDRIYCVEHCVEKDLYCTSTSARPRISIINPDTLQVIKSFDRSEFSFPYSLTCTQVNNQPCMVICKYGKDQINVIDFQDQELFTIRLDLSVGGLNRPYDVITDPGERIIVCDESNKRVISVCREEGGIKSKVLIDKEQFSNMSDVRYLVYDPSEEKLFVGCLGGTIRVFQSG